MKTRLSFVSNSSSSSFCLAGVPFDQEKFKVDADNLDALDYFEQAIKDEDYDKLVYGQMAHSIRPLVVENTEDEGEYGNVYIGLPFNEMESNETKEQFRQRSFEELKKFGYKGELEDVGYYLGCARH